METDWLSEVKGYLKEAAAGPGQKRAAYEAAKQVAVAPGTMGAALRSGFSTWLVKGHWLEPEFTPDMNLDARSHLSQDAIRDHYRPERGGRFDFTKAEADAVQAHERRVSRCAAHLEAGRPETECMAFVYGRDEWTQAKQKAGTMAASPERELVAAVAPERFPF